MDHVNLAHFYRFLWKESDLIVVIGNGTEIAKGRAAYNTHYGIEREEDVREKSLLRLLTATGLAAVSLPDRQSWGWTLSLPGDAVGFFCGIEPEGSVCGRAQDADPERNLVVVQRQKPEEPIVQSMFTPMDPGTVRVVESYFEESEQILTRLAVLPDLSGVCFKSLPGGQFDRVTDLSDEELVRLAADLEKDGRLEPMDEYLLFYECRCNPDMILDLVRNLPEDQREELWAGQTALDIECPRCGRPYRLEKNT